MYKAAGPFPYLTKASNQVENVLEARGLGLQLFFKGLLEKNRGQQGFPPPRLCFPFGPAFRHMEPVAASNSLGTRASRLPSLVEGCHL